MATNQIGTYIMLGILSFGMVIGWVLPGDKGDAAAYSMNFATRASGIIKLNLVLLQSVSTTNCTGITSSALTTISSPHLLVTGSYTAQSNNITGLSATMKVTVSTNVPSTVFGTGSCASLNNGLVTTQGIYFPAIQTATTGTSFPFSFTFDGATVGATYYAWIDIVQVNGPGHVKFSSLGSNQYSWITVVELR